MGVSSSVILASYSTKRVLYVVVHGCAASIASSRTLRMGCSLSTSGACQTSGRPFRLPVSLASVSPLSLSVRCSITFQACSGYLVLGDMVQTSDSQAEPLLVLAPTGLGCGA